MLQGILFFFVIVAGTLGELCISRAMKSIGEIHDFRPRSVLQFVGRALQLPWTLAGITLMALGFFSLVGVLSIDEVSFVVPFSALNYVVGALGARFLLRERISGRRLLGIATVVVGVTLVWWSRH